MELYMLKDTDGDAIPIMDLSSSHDVDGTDASAPSNAIQGYAVRIVSIDNALRVAKGANPIAAADGILIQAAGELWLPIVPGQKVAVLGGRANICTVGEDRIAE